MVNRVRRGAYVLWELRALVCVIIALLATTWLLYPDVKWELRYYHEHAERFDFSKPASQPNQVTMLAPARIPHVTLDYVPVTPSTSEQR